MVKLDVSLLRFLEDEDFRVLTALEMTMRNHDVAPTVLVERIAQLPHGGARKRLQSLLKHKIIHHENTMYDGYAMKYGAYDFLALHTFSKRGTVAGVAHRIGCGKESDIILVHDENEQECVLKLQRLGRCSFRTVTRNRDYKGGGKSRHGESWFYLSRLASQKEYNFMKVLYDEGFPVPKPIDQNRHALVMELVPGTVLNNVVALANPEKVYRRSLECMIRLAESGLIHGDFNEFNLMVTEEEQIIMIDFPQMVSIEHQNAAELFDRDVINLANFFTRRFKLQVKYFPTLAKDVTRKGNLDHQVFASGCFSKKNQQHLELLCAQQQQEEASEGEESTAESGSDKDEAREGEEEREERAQKTSKRIQKTNNKKERTSLRQGDEDDNHLASRDAPITNSKVATTSKEGDANHHDPTTGSSLPGSTLLREEKNEEEKEEEQLGETDSENSLEDGINKQREARRLEHLLMIGHPLNGKKNANFLPDGDFNEEHLKRQVRKSIHQKDNREFNRCLHRNTQKGRKKIAIKRQLRNAAAEHTFFD